jgi:hypothetical protein
MVGMVVDFTAFDDRYFLVQELDQGAHKAAFGLALFPEKNDVVVGQDRVGQLGDDGLVEAVDFGKKGLAGFQLLEKVSLEFFFNGEIAVAGGP